MATNEAISTTETTFWTTSCHGPNPNCTWPQWSLDGI